MTTISSNPVLQALGNKEDRIKKLNAPNERKLEIIKLQIDKNNEKAQALDKLRTLVSNYALAATSISSVTKNPFSNNKVNLTTSENNGNATNYVNVTLGANSSEGNFNVSVKQVATASKLVIGNNGNAIAAAPGLEGNLRINVGGINNDIQVIAGNKLSDITFNINKQFSANNIPAQALLINATDEGYIEIRHNQTGLNHITMSWQNFNDLPAVSALSQLTNTNGVDATIMVEGIDITQSSNIFKDVFSGVTVTAISPNNSLNNHIETQTINIVNDPDAIYDLLANFTLQYNELAIFTAKMSERNDKGFVETAILNNSLELGQAQDLLDSFTSSINSGDGKYKKLSDIGISLKNVPIKDVPAGVLTLQTTNLNLLVDAVTNNLSDFTNLFRGTSKFVSNAENQGSSLSLANITNILPANILKLPIHIKIPVINGQITNNSVTVTVDNHSYQGIYENGLITFPHTPLSHLNFAYKIGNVLNHEEQFTINLTQGIMDISYYKSAELINENKGSIILAQKELASSLNQVTDNRTRTENAIANKIAQIDTQYDKINIIAMYHDLMIDHITNLIDPKND